MLRVVTLALCLTVCLHAADAPPKPPTMPKSREDLRTLQLRSRWVLDRVMPAVVGIAMGGGRSMGSGVIVTADGLVMTAGHVSGPKGSRHEVIFADGTRAPCVSLAQDMRSDAGLLKISGPKKDYPFVQPGDSRRLKVGDWVLGVGHPGGWREGRHAVVRLGRVLSNQGPTIRSDATLVGGDSGGPLFDVDGLVVGIHSRIAGGPSNNFHATSSSFAAWLEEHGARVPGASAQDQKTPKKD